MKKTKMILTMTGHKVSPYTGNHIPPITDRLFAKIMAGYTDDDWITPAIINAHNSISKVKIK